MLLAALPEFGITHVLPPEPLDAIWRRFVFEWALSDFPEETHMTEAAIIPVERIEKRIYLLREEKVMLDADLAELYGVTTKRLNEAVRRNRERFPADFMFQLTLDEVDSLRSQIATSSYGGRRYRPYAFTEQGVAMLSGVLKSKRAIQVNVEIIRTFVRLRQMLSTHKDLARKIIDLEAKYDGKFKLIFEALRQLMEPAPEKPKPRIGFVSEGKRGKK